MTYLSLGLWKRMLQVRVAGQMGKRKCPETSEDQGLFAMFPCFLLWNLMAQQLLREAGTVWKGQKRLKEGVPWVATPPFTQVTQPAPGVSLHRLWPGQREQTVGSSAANETPGRALLAAPSPHPPQHLLPHQASCENSSRGRVRMVLLTLGLGCVRGKPVFI